MRSLGLKKILPTLLVTAFAGACSLNQDVATVSLKADSPEMIQKAQRGAERFYQIGRYFQGQLRYGDAVAAYRDCLNLMPEHVEARNALAVSLALLGQYEDAIVVFTEMTGQEPDNARHWHNLGYAYLLAGKEAEAKQALQKAVTLNPANTRTQAYLARAQANTPNPVVLASPAKEVPSPLAAQPVRPEQNSLAASVVPATPKSYTVVANQQSVLVSLGKQIYELRSNKSRSEAVKAMAVVEPPKRVAENAPVSGDLRGVEISNGNGVTGMGKWVARFLIQEGVKTARLTNQVGFKARQTELQYRDGYREQATRLAGILQHPVALKEAAHLRSDINVKLVLGRDVVKVAEAQSEPSDVAAKLASQETTGTQGG